MKVKIGKLTINQTIRICEKYYEGLCKGCPLCDHSSGCVVFGHPFTIKILKSNERKIELRRREEKENAEIH